jgi:hypothetical protein
MQSQPESGSAESREVEYYIAVHKKLASKVITPKSAFDGRIKSGEANCEVLYRAAGGVTGGKVGLA